MVDTRVKVEDLPPPLSIRSRPDILDKVGVPPEKPPMPTDRERVLNHLNRKNLSPAAIAGIWGNIDVETGGTFKFDEPEEEGTGYGLFQFTDYTNKDGELVGHLTSYNKYLEDNGLIDRPESQIDYVLDNIYSGIGEDIGYGNREKLREVFELGNAEQIALEFSSRFENPEVPHNDRRVQSAIEIFDSMSQKHTGGMIQRNPYPYNPRPI